MYGHIKVWSFVLFVLLSMTASGQVAEDETRRRFNLTLVDTNGRPVVNQVVRFRCSPFVIDVVKGKEDRVTRSTLYAVTDDNGQLGLSISKDCFRLEFSLNTDGYGPYIGRWDREKSGAPIPEEFRADIDLAWSVGGVVVDEDGKPIQGVTVDPSVDFKRRPGDQRRLGTGDRVATDENGRWRYDRVPAPTESVWFAFTHRQYMPYRASLSRDKFEVKHERQPTEQIVLPRGLTFSGKVTDLDGKPIEGAVVRTKFLNDERGAITGADGNYTIFGCEERSVRIVASAKNYALELVKRRVNRDMDDVDFRMSPGGHVRIRVIDAEGNGLHRARIFFQRWRGRIDYFEFDEISQYTDEHGIWEWNEAPVDEFYADICHPRGMQLGEQRIVTRKEEYVFSPPPYLMVSGLVVDSETKKLLSDFRVVPGVQGQEDGPINWVLDEAKSATNGRYNIRHIDEDCFAHLIRIEAEGYVPQISRNIDSDEGDVTIHFKLERGKNIESIVLSADGKPVKDAIVALAIPGTQLSIDNGFVDDGSTYNALKRTTNEEGLFLFPPQVTPFHLVILSKSGYAHLKLKPNQAIETIKLRPWAKLKGRYLVGDEPGADKVISLSCDAIHSYGEDVPNIFLHFDATTGRDGTFRFDRIPEGTGWVRREIVRMVRDGATEVASTPINALSFKSGRTSSVELGGKGVAVIGQVLPPKGKQLENWRQVDVDAQLALPKPPIAPDAKEEEWQKWRDSEEGKSWLEMYKQASQRQRLATQYDATVDDSGNFRIDDVIPGDYEIIVHYHGNDGRYSTTGSFSVEKYTQDPIKLDPLKLQ